MMRKKILSVLLTLSIVLTFAFVSYGCETADSVFVTTGADNPISVNVTSPNPLSVNITGPIPLSVNVTGPPSLTGNTSLIYGYNGTAFNPVQQDATTWAMTTIDYAHHETHASSFYYVKGTQDVSGAGTNLDFLWCVADTPKWPHAQWSFLGEAEFILSLYEDVTVSANGTLVPIFNANRNSINTAGVVAFSGPTLAGGALGDGGLGGTLVWQATIGSGKDATQGRESSHEFIGKQGVDYWYQITKDAAGTAWVDWDFNWYEHTNR